MAAAIPRSSCKAETIYGRDEDILYVKGSGWDLETIERSRLCTGAAQARCSNWRHLRHPQRHADGERTALRHDRRPRADAVGRSDPARASCRYKYVDHTHADAVIAVTNTANGDANAFEEIYGDSVVIIPYVMPGFKLARLCADIFPAAGRRETIGMILLNHGVFSFGATARESYERMIDLVSRAEDYLQAAQRLADRSACRPAAETSTAHELAALRRKVRRYRRISR